MQAVGILWGDDELYESKNLTDWDYYLIYSSDTENGVMIPCWYLELTMIGQKVRVLIDAVDDTIYYMECYNYGIWERYLANQKIDESVWYDLSYDLLSLKSYYGSYTWDMKWAQLSQYSILGNSSEIISELPYDNGVLTLDAGFLEEEDGNF